MAQIPPTKARTSPTTKLLNGLLIINYRAFFGEASGWAALWVEHQSDSRTDKTWEPLLMIQGLSWFQEKEPTGFVCRAGSWRIFRFTLYSFHGSGQHSFQVDLLDFRYRSQIEHKIDALKLTGEVPTGEITSPSLSSGFYIFQSTLEWPSGIEVLAVLRA